MEIRTLFRLISYWNRLSVDRVSQEIYSQQAFYIYYTSRGLQDETVLKAISAVPREEFVPTELVEFAYSDSPLPIAARQTISQPYIVALMTAALELEPEDRVLEVGTGYTQATACHRRSSGDSGRK